MDRGELLAALTDARPGPVDVVYVERRGEEYSCRVTSPEEPLLLGGGGGEFPDVWLYWSGNWPADDLERQRELFDDLLAEMETMVSGGDRCRWSPDEPWPRQH
ncbi:MAG TPA: hypothetical protein VFF24_06935 [Acidimicrobiia bacterium]|nr:hypothetical protein [Acidimicrobiia bacterium]